MAIASNLMNAVIMAPFVVILSAVSLATLQRSMEWVAMIANNPQKYAVHYDIVMGDVICDRCL
jgi:hypothetical protein